MFGLLPLETYTLPGWPVAQHPGLMESLALFLGIPGAIGVVIVLLAYAPAWFSKGNATE